MGFVEVQAYLILKTFASSLTNHIINKVKHTNEEHNNSGSIWKIICGTNPNRKKIKILNVPNTNTLQTKLCLAEISWN